MVHNIPAEFAAPVALSVTVAAADAALVTARAALPTVSFSATAATVDETVFATEPAACAAETVTVLITFAEKESGQTRRLRCVRLTHSERVDGGTRVL